MRMQQYLLVTYDSGVDGHYISEKDRQKLGLPILRISAKKVGVANGDTCRGKYVTVLPFPQLSKEAAEAEAKATARWTKRQRTNHLPRPLPVLPPHQLQRDTAAAGINQRAVGIETRLRY